MRARLRHRCLIGISFYAGKAGVILHIHCTKNRDLARCAGDIADKARQGKAAHVKVHVDFDGERLTLRIVDDGCGFDLGNHPTGLGLSGMEDRARALGGRFKLLSEVNHGTCVIVEVKV